MIYIETYNLYLFTLKLRVNNEQENYASNRFEHFKHD